MKNRKSKFKVGDQVIYTNSYGVEWPGKTITKIEETSKGFVYYYTPDDSPWAPVREDQLRHDEAATKGKAK